MNISFVLAVYNKLELTKECYKRLREIYPTSPLVISSGGSSDGTKEWLESLEDNELSFFHDDTRLTFSETYNAGIDLVDTEKIVLIHNDMVIGEGFLESIERLLTDDMILSYTTIEPPIFKGHQRPGKVLLDLGSSFEDFDNFHFNNYVQQWNGSNNLYDGAVFFMSAYKKVFQDLNGFDGFSFVPCFCEDDDFLIRAKLKGYKLKTCDSAIVYHFVSQTSTFNQLNYQNQENFEFKTYTMGLTINNKSRLFDIEPFFNKINLGESPDEYIELEQKNTRYDLKSKFIDTDNVDVMVYADELTDNDFNLLFVLRATLPKYDVGEYKIGNFKIEIKNKL
jgi:GT2 family glycosyltransferase